MQSDNEMEMHVFVLLLQLSLIIAGSYAVNPSCDCLIFSATYGKERGEFTSPDYPKPYPQNIDCILYTFIASSDEIIEINFEKFDVLKTNHDCVRGDYIKLFPHLERGEVNEYTPWAALLCGTIADVPTAIYSSGSGLVFEFHTGSLRGNATGFKGTFRFIDKRLFQSDGQRLPGTMCDHQFVSSDYAPSHGRFYSPRYPSSYPKNIRCSYRFRARTKERIRVVFEEVTLQKGDLSCLNRADLIKVHDGRNAMAPTIKMLCNVGTEMEVLSTGSDLYIEFVANSEWPGQGFKATYQFQPIDDNTSSSSSSSSSSASSSVSSSSSGAATGCQLLLSRDICLRAHSENGNQIFYLISFLNRLELMAASIGITMFGIFLTRMFIGPNYKIV